MDHFDHFCQDIFGGGTSKIEISYENGPENIEERLSCGRVAWETSLPTDIFRISQKVSLEFRYITPNFLFSPQSGLYIVLPLRVQHGLSLDNNF